ncbi:anti-sigma factor [Nocardia altamirensis]|uniref:anti-sigma factor n=1 Tax=Nocardia altamirensis TaxID=472158 RepID=UPI000840488A|nr:anti-sigma factor [Nocardia altamirensis]
MTAEIHSRTGAYVLDALDDDERAAFDEHLTECRACRTEVADLRPVAARLGIALTPMSAGSLKERVLADLGAHRQLPATAALGSTQIMPAVDDLTRTAVLPSLEGWTDDDYPEEDRRWWTHSITIGIAAAAAAIVVVLGGLALVDRTPASETTVAMEQVRDARDAVTKTGRVVTGNGMATAVLSRSLGKIVVSANGLPAVDDRHGYQLWTIPADGTPWSAGMMHTSGTHAELATDLRAGTTQITITTEPTEGSPEPTTPMVVRIDLS